MYKYELHQHTAGCSRCARVSPEDMVFAIKESGFSGVVVTNHFYHGNSSIDRDLPWQEFCKAYVDEYLAAKRIGDMIGVDVIYGLEEAVAPGKEVLLYGVEPDLIGRYPELESLGLARLSEIVRNAGGLVIQAHPFRARDYIPDPDELLETEYLDGYEVYNRGNPDEENRKAVALALKTGLIRTAGSDSHGSETDRRFGISVDSRLRCEKDLADVLRSGDYRLVHDLDF